MALRLSVRKRIQHASFAQRAKHTLSTCARRRIREDPRQGRLVGRFREVHIESCARRLLLVLFLAEPCQRHKQDPAAQNTTNPLTGLVSVEPSHPDVKEDDLRLVLLDHRESALAVVGDSRVSTHVLDEHCRRIRRILVVVDDQNSSFEQACVGGRLGGSDQLRSSLAAVG